MNLLVGGCSFSSGWGFDNTIEKTWPRLLANQLGARLVNVSESGYDNVGIFINFLQQIHKQDFDICLFQVTSLNRIILSPNWNGHQLCRNINISNGFMSDSQYDNWYKNFLLLNQSCEHWSRLLKIIDILQSLAKQGKYIRFVNGLLDWDRELFQDVSKSKFFNRLIDVDNILDADIDRLRKIVYNQVKDIDLNLWINPFENFIQLKTDIISINDEHPGPNSHERYSNLIFNYLKENNHA
jgi:hypothetical protein